MKARAFQTYLTVGVLMELQKTSKHPNVFILDASSILES